MRGKHTILNFLIIIASGIIPWLLLALFRIDDSLFRLGLQILTTSVPPLILGWLIQSLANFRGRSKRTLLQGSAFYGAYIAVALCAVRVGIVLVVVMSRV